MALVERTMDAPAHWPTLDELEQLASPNTVIMLPDRLDRDDQTLVAAFRLDAQGLRVAAQESGWVPILHAPPEAELAMYTEHAADWILPVIVAAVLAVPSQIGATLVADWIEGHIPQHPNAQTIVYREAVIDHGKLRLYEVEGAPPDVAHLLRARELQEPPPPQSPPEQGFPPLSPTPPDHLGR